MSLIPVLPSDQRIVEIVLAELMAELGTDLLGLLATGSRINGRVDRNSDLDLVAVIADPVSQRRTRFVEGVEVVLDIGPRDWVLQTLHRDRVLGTGIAQHMWATGIIVYDCRGAMRSLKEEATRQWDAGPGEVPEEDRWRFRVPPTKMLEDAELLAEVDEVQATHVLSCVLVRLLDTHCRLHNRWSEKAKRALDDVARWDPTGAALFRRAYVGSVRERVLATRELAAHSLAEVGGLMPHADWHTKWRQLPTARAQQPEKDMQRLSACSSLQMPQRGS